MENINSQFLDDFDHRAAAPKGPTQHVTRSLKLTQSVLRTHHLVHPTTLMKQQTKISTRVLMVIAIRITM